MATRYRIELLQDALSALCHRVCGVEQAVMTSLEGFVVASYPSSDDESESPLPSPKIAATAASAVALGEGSLQRLEHGGLERLIIEGETGSVIIHPIRGADAALIAITAKDAKMGLVSLAMRQSIAALESILSQRTVTSR
jgi:predicted regulator of Ras-like GTPase activity (Roadblock/LC7/MglB family)